MKEMISRGLSDTLAKIEEVTAAGDKITGLKVELGKVTTQHTSLQTTVNSLNEEIVEMKEHMVKQEI